MNKKYIIIETEEFINRLRNNIPKEFHNAINKAILRLKENPFLSKSRLKDSMLMKYEVSRFRILYYVNGNVLEIWTIDIIPRKDNYKELNKIEQSFNKKYPSAQR